MLLQFVMQYFTSWQRSEVQLQETNYEMHKEAYVYNDMP
jgi:hypothetical protein